MNSPKCDQCGRGMVMGDDMWYCQRCYKPKPDAAAELAKLRRCGTCGGDGGKASNLPCVCGGTGLASDETAGLRRAALTAQAELAALRAENSEQLHNLTDLRVKLQDCRADLEREQERRAAADESRQAMASLVAGKDAALSDRDAQLASFRDGYHGIAAAFGIEVGDTNDEDLADRVAILRARVAELERELDALLRLKCDIGIVLGDEQGPPFVDTIRAWKERRDAAESARDGLLREIQAAIDAGVVEVDKANDEHGYDSLRFADVRHGWLAVATPLRALIARAALARGEVEGG